jgi:hypothetical protein
LCDFIGDHETGVMPGVLIIFSRVAESYH